MRGKNLDELYPYVLNDQGFGLRGRPFNLTVSWNIMPHVGGYQEPKDCTACVPGA